MEPLHFQKDMCKTNRSGLPFLLRSVEKEQAKYMNEWDKLVNLEHSQIKVISTGDKGLGTGD